MDCTDPSLTQWISLTFSLLQTALTGSPVGSAGGVWLLAEAVTRFLPTKDTASFTERSGRIVRELLNAAKIPNRQKAQSPQDQGAT